MKTFTIHMPSVVFLIQSFIAKKRRKIVRNQLQHERLAWPCRRRDCSLSKITGDKCHLFIYNLTFHRIKQGIFHTETVNWQDFWKIPLEVTAELSWLLQSGKFSSLNQTQLMNTKNVCRICLPVRFRNDKLKHFKSKQQVVGIDE